MPQVDLEASDRKIACETLADDSPIEPYINYAVSPTDFPPESYYLSKDDDQLEWFSDNNAFFDRQDSQRGNSGNLNSNPNSSSQRFLLKSKASIIGLPKPQETCFIEAKQRRHTGKVENSRNIVKRVGSLINTDPSLREPSSPMVSCIGRVRSRRERSRRMQRQKSAPVDPVKEKPNRVNKPGFMTSVKAIFRIGRGNKDVSARGTNTLSSRAHDIRSRLPQEHVDRGEPVVPGLGVMSRFSSGRRTDLLGG